MNTTDSKVNNIFPYILRLIFTSTAMLYICFFTIKGISILIFSFSGVDYGIHWTNFLSKVMSNLIIIHIIIGIYYVIFTRYNLKSRQRGKVFFYLQLLSAIAVFMGFYRFSEGIPDHSLLQRIGDIILSVLFAYHIGNGFYNACITLGISVSKKVITVVKYSAWIVAVLSVIQIVIVNILGRV